MTLKVGDILHTRSHINNFYVGIFLGKIRDYYTVRYFVEGDTTGHSTTRYTSLNEMYGSWEDYEI